MPGSGKSDQYVTYGPMRLMGPGEYICIECGEDLDDNGLFSEERAMEEVLQKLIKGGRNVAG